MRRFIILWIDEHLSAPRLNCSFLKNLDCSQNPRPWVQKVVGVKLRYLCTHCPLPRIMGPELVLHDGGKRFRIERSPAHQRPVDLFLSHERGYVLGLDRTAVENA